MSSLCGRGFSRDERLSWLVLRMGRRWIRQPNLVDRVRWNRWLNMTEARGG